MLTFTRDLLDCHVRRRLRGFSRVNVLEETDVVGLMPNADRSGVAGAVIRSRATENDEHECAADLVVDASHAA